jgi:hypothetical protein
VSDMVPDGVTDRRGRALARRVKDVADRGRAELSGVLVAVVVHRQRPARGPLHPGALGPCLDARLDDGTGTITLRWLGREAIPGVVAGARLHVEGVVSSQSGRPLMLNPRYGFDAPQREAVADADPPAAGPGVDGGRGEGPATGRADRAQAESSTSW